jgi:hypothetical protein
MAHAKQGLTLSALAETIDRLRLFADELSRYDYEGAFALIQGVPWAAGSVIDWTILSVMRDAVNEADTMLVAAQEANEDLEDALRALAGLLEEERELAAAS